VGAQEVKKWGPALFKQSCSPINNLGDEASPIFLTATSKPIFSGLGSRACFVDPQVLSRLFLMERLCHIWRA
jgi:hypothetical protein